MNRIYTATYAGGGVFYPYIYGGPCRIRTCDQVIKSNLPLYALNPGLLPHMGVYGHLESICRLFGGTLEALICPLCPLFPLYKHMIST